MAGLNVLSKPQGHVWTFFRAGGFDQVALETGADLLHLDELDQKLWTALACPTTGLEFDPKTMALIDADKDGRVRVPELLAAIKWAGAQLKNPDLLIKGGDSLALEAINDAGPVGKQIHASAHQLLINMGKEKEGRISLADVTDASKIFSNTVFNGDGIIVPGSLADAAHQAVVTDIINTLGPLTDRSGQPGVDQTRVEAFFTQAAAFEAWMTKSETDAATILPLGPATAAASGAIKAAKAKVDDYFARCRLAAFDGRARGALNRQETEYLQLAAKDLTISAVEIAAFPLALIAPCQSLPLAGDQVNPAHAGLVSALYTQAIVPLLGERNELTEADWATLQAKIAAFDAWQAAKAGGEVEKLGLARIRAILAANPKDAILAAIAQDKALEPQATGISDVEKLLRFVRDLHTLCTNFVNFKDLYDGGAPAIFQCGTLYLDQRSCNLCLPVEDAGKHASMAGLAGAYLAYCDCVRKATGEKLSMVAVFSQGDDDNLMVGRNGVFYDRKGKDYDATITKIVSNPIGLRQAFWLPYKKFVRMIEEQVAKRAAAADADATTKLTAAASATANLDKTKPAEPKKVDVGTVAALGVAFGAIGTFVAAIVGYLTGIIAMGPLAILALILGVIALISGPSMILAYIKLRKRNLGPILDANGWAVNARAKINVPFGTSLTGLAKLPPGSKRNLTDAFAEKTTGRNWAITAAVLAAILGGLWYFGATEWIKPGLFPKSSFVLRQEQMKKEAEAEQEKEKTLKSIEENIQSLQETVKKLEATVSAKAEPEKK